MTDEKMEQPKQHRTKSVAEMDSEQLVIRLMARRLGCVKLTMEEQVQERVMHMLFPGMRSVHSPTNQISREQSVKSVEDAENEHD